MKDTEPKFFWREILLNYFNFLWVWEKKEEATKTVPAVHRNVYTDPCQSVFQAWRFKGKMETSGGSPTSWSE